MMVVAAVLTTSMVLAAVMIVVAAVRAAARVLATATSRFVRPAILGPGIGQLIMIVVGIAAGVSKRVLEA